MSLKQILEKQRQNSLYWENYFSENNINSIQSIKVIKEARPNYWIYGILVNNKHEALKFFREKNFYASSVHLNNNNYSVFDNSIKLTGVDEFSNQFLALPCGWWMN